MERHVFDKLIKLADVLDRSGLQKEADAVDRLVRQALEIETVESLLAKLHNMKSIMKTLKEKKLAVWHAYLGWRPQIWDEPNKIPLQWPHQNFDTTDRHAMEGIEANIDELIDLLSHREGSVLERTKKNIHELPQTLKQRIQDVKKFVQDDMAMHTAQQKRAFQNAKQTGEAFEYQPKKTHPFLTFKSKQEAIADLTPALKECRLWLLKLRDAARNLPTEDPSGFLHSLFDRLNDINHFKVDWNSLPALKTKVENYVTYLMDYIDKDEHIIHFGEEPERPKQDWPPSQH